MCTLKNYCKLFTTTVQNIKRNSVHPSYFLRTHTTSYLIPTLKLHPMQPFLVQKLYDYYVTLQKDSDYQYPIHFFFWKYLVGIGKIIFILFEGDLWHSIWKLEDCLYGCLWWERRWENWYCRGTSTLQTHALLIRVNQLQYFKQTSS